MSGGMLAAGSEVYGPSDGVQNGNKTIFSTYHRHTEGSNKTSMGKDLLGLVQARGVFFINFPYSYIQVPGNQREKTRFAEYRLTKI